jgi:hypothetical protein
LPSTKVETDQEWSAALEAVSGGGLPTEVIAADDALTRN